jgi:hypothetical protein
LAEITKHYNDGDVIEPEELAQYGDRISLTHAQKGLEELADDGLIEESDGTYRR